MNAKVISMLCIDFTNWAQKKSYYLNKKNDGEFHQELSEQGLLKFIFNKSCIFWCFPVPPTPENVVLTRNATNARNILDVAWVIQSNSYMLSSFTISLISNSGLNTTYNYSDIVFGNNFGTTIGGLTSGESYVAIIKSQSEAVYSPDSAPSSPTRLSKYNAKIWYWATADGLQNCLNATIAFVIRNWFIYILVETKPIIIFKWCFVSMSCVCVKHTYWNNVVILKQCTTKCFSVSKPVSFLVFFFNLT